MIGYTVLALALALVLPADGASMKSYGSYGTCSHHGGMRNSMKDRRRRAAHAIVAGIIAIACFGRGAQAADVQAYRFSRDLVTDCVGRDLDFCTGYIAGIADLMTSLYAVTGNPKFHVCLPPSTTPTDLAKVVVDFIGAQKTLDGDASGSVYFAIRDKYPCSGA